MIWNYRRILIFLFTIAFFSCQDIGKNYNWRGDPPIGFNRKFGSGGYDYGWGVSYSPFDEGFIVVGRKEMSLNGEYDLWAIKTDKFGLTEWTKNFGGDRNDEGNDAIVTSNGDFIFVGNSWSFGSGQQLYIVKTDMYGNEKWQKTYGGSNWDVGMSVKETKDGNYLITGYSNSPGISSGNTDVYLLKIDKNGNQLWQKAHGKESENNHEWANDLIEVENGDFLVVGARDYYDAYKRNILLLKVDKSGELIWEKEFNAFGAVDEVGYTISSSPLGGYFICASVNSIEEPHRFNPQIIKIDSFGNLDWTRTYNASGMYYHRFGASGLEDGGLIITGSTNYFANPGDLEDALLIRIDYNGNVLWSNSYGSGDHDDWGWDVIETPQKNIVFVGATKSYGASLFDIFLVGTDAQGLSN